MARVLVKQQPPARSSTPKIGVLHAHGCRSCGRRYQDTCPTPLQNKICRTCSLGHAPTQEDRDREPRACCKTSSRLVTDVDILSRYNLGGDGAWFICSGPTGCFRTHPFNPKETP